MDGWTLQNRISKGMGVAARRSGTPFTIYRPCGAIQPLAAQNRVLQLYAAFYPGNSGGKGGADYGRPLWRGVYDAFYTQAGDYLVSRDNTYFVASQQVGLPVQCVRTNRVVSLVRPTPATQGGYSGFYATPGDTVLAEWPASLLADGGRADEVKVGETRLGVWTLLLPTLPVCPQTADVVSDDAGGVYAVGSAEESVLGWRLAVRQLGA